MLAAVSVSGLPTDRFHLRRLSAVQDHGRRAFFAELAPIRASLVFFEGGSRLGASLADMAAVLGPREAMVGRELTKLYETCIRGPLDILAADPALAAPKGEMVVVVGSRRGGGCHARRRRRGAG